MAGAKKRLSRHQKVSRELRQGVVHQRVCSLRRTRRQSSKGHPFHERGEATDDKILAALAAVTYRLLKLKYSQRFRHEDERMIGAFESGMFASNLGANMRGCPMTIDELGLLERKPAAHRAGSLCPDHSESMFVSLAPPRGQ